jgi:nitroreductase
MSHRALQGVPSTSPREAGSSGATHAAACVAERIAARETWDAAQALIESRQNIAPKRLFSPGPTAQELHELLLLAAAAPDHGLLNPWRYVLVPREQRPALGEVFALALVDRDPGATLEQIESAREKAYRAPLLLVAIARLARMTPDTPALERLVSMGAAIQNLLLGAHAMGFGAGLTSGRAMESHRMGELLQLAEGEQAVCCINIGTPDRARKREHPRPVPGEFLTVLGAGATSSLPR